MKFIKQNNQNALIVLAIFSGCDPERPNAPQARKDGVPEGRPTSSFPALFSRAKQGGKIRGGVWDEKKYFSLLDKGLGKTVCRKRPRLRYKFRSATDKVEAAIGVRATDIHESQWNRFHKLYECCLGWRGYVPPSHIVQEDLAGQSPAKPRLKSSIPRVIRGIRGQIPSKIVQKMAEFGKKWQNGTVWYRYKFSSMRQAKELRKMGIENKSPLVSDWIFRDVHEDVQF